MNQVKLYNEKRSDLEEQQLHLNVGLQKIKETVDQVCLILSVFTICILVFCCMPVPRSKKRYTINNL